MGEVHTEFLLDVSPNAFYLCSALYCQALLQKTDSMEFKLFPKFT